VSHKKIMEQFKLAEEEVEDPRMDRAKRYPLSEILLLCFIAILSGANHWTHIEDFGNSRLDYLREKFGGFDNGIPSHDVIGNLMKKINPKEFQNFFFGFTQQLSEMTKKNLVALDGKWVKGSGDGNHYPVKLVSAWCQENQLVLGQERVPEGSNEITAIERLINLLDLEGAVVTIDAIGCQKEIVESIVRKKADYQLAVKKNQEILHEVIEKRFETMEKYDYVWRVETDHGRIEKRECWSLPFQSSEWKKAKSIVRVRASRTMNGKTSVEDRYYISSLKPDAKRQLELSRGHWEIENKLHWSLDVVFAEDKLQKKDNGAENFSIMAKSALVLVKKEKTFKGGGSQLKRLKASWDPDYLDVILSCG